MLSVLIITKDEEKQIKACLESVQSLANEVIVLDTGSTDRTVEIARRYTEKVYKNQWKDFATARDQALEKAKGDWVLYIDADERILADLRKEILEITSRNPSEAAFQIPRRNIILGEEKKYPAFWPDYVIRLFKKDQLAKWQGEVHEQPEFSGPLGTITSPILHLTHRDIDSMVLKSLSWANIDARLRFAAHHPKMNGWRFLRIFLTETWYQGIIRRGFFNGTVGVIDSLLQIFSLYLSYVKLWQLQRGESLEQSYEKIDQDLISNNFRY